jgi:NitT/TauT family transport system ATP-binding protein
MTRLLRISYMPLTDAGLLFVAAAKNFDRDEGLRFELRPEASWANLRDKLALGICDAAHMLAPAVVASALGLDGFPAEMIGAAALGLDGNAISVSPALGAALRGRISGDAGDPRATARALAEVVAERAQLGEPRLRFAHVFPFSTHHYQLRLWLGAGKIDSAAVRLTVTPPPLMEPSISGGYIDGFCVGEPWNTLAQQARVSEILHPCRALVKDCPEKVLAFPRDAATLEPELPRAAARAIRRAAAWGEREENRGEFCALIAEKLGSGVTQEMVAASLGFDEKSEPWLRLDAQATALSGAQALWLFVLMVGAGQVESTDLLADAAAKAFWPLDGAPAATSVTLHGGAKFDPVNWRASLALVQ